MAELKMSNATFRGNKPVDLIGAHQEHGRLRIGFDEIEFLTEAAVSDTVVGPKIPKGAQVYDVKIISDQLASVNTQGQIGIGWGAGVNGDEAASANGFLAAQETGGAALNTSMLGAIADASNVPAGFGKKFADECELLITFDEVTDARATNKKLKVYIYYVLD